MTKESNTDKEKIVGDQISQRQAKIKMRATKGHPYIETGTIFEVHPVHEDNLRKKGWAVGEKEDHTKAPKAAVPLKAGDIAAESGTETEAAGNEAKK